jgi:exodeoxyribonuclease VII large subunit
MAVETLGVTELCRRISTALGDAFPDQVWVAGELQGLRSRGGHLYFTLVDPGELGDGPAASIPVALFRGNRRAVEHVLDKAGGLALADGLAVRIRGEVILYPPRSQVQVRMTAIDPGHTLGRLALDRDRLLRALAAEGLVDRNARLPLEPVPLRVALVTSAGSAAAHDTLHELEVSGLGFAVTLVDTRVQGPDAVDSVVAALAHAARLDVDAVALVRGGGSRTDLVAFDAEAVARAVAACPRPVLTGIGHEIDTSVADAVAHTALTTPTAVAGFLVQRARRHLDALERAWARVARRADQHLAHDDRRLVALATRAGAAAGGHLRRADDRVGRAGAAVAAAPRRALADAERDVTGLEHRVTALDPARVLARGWSITRTAGGGLVRSVADAPPTTELVTTVADGAVRSVVTEPPDDHPEEAAP